ncbi:PIN-like domain-containing protein [Sphingomonas parapaucimobilis]|uniref:PIN-like domain-containing protein n=1 Tax=Sphingomonas parapaucimobilis TaxID=28213 RepID=UPI003218F539
MVDPTAKKHRVVLPPLHLTSLYPDAKALFTHEVVSPQEAFSEGIIAIDTSVLLAPYDAGGLGYISDIAKVYRRLAEEGRLLIAGQVVREFHVNRIKKLQAVVANIKSSMPTRFTVPSVGSHVNSDAFGKLSKLSDVINTKIKTIREMSDQYCSAILADECNDVVLSMYKDHLANSIVELSGIDKNGQEFIREADERRKSNIPPGLLDENKADGGYGDFIIWKTILQEGGSRKKHCVFVNNEKKDDYFTKASDHLIVKSEIVEEYRQVSGGKTIVIIDLPDFLKLVGAEAEIVDQAKLDAENMRRADEQLRNGTVEQIRFQLSMARVNLEKLNGIRNASLSEARAFEAVIASNSIVEKAARAEDRMMFDRVRKLLKDADDVGPAIFEQAKIVDYLVEELARVETRL